MYQFFTDPSQINIEARRVTITGEDVNHIRNVLRMKIGEEINVSNGLDGNEYRCAIESFEADSVECELRFVKEDSHELPIKVCLFQGLPKSDKMETIIQKNVELGVFSIIPVEMKRCVVKLDPKKVQSKISRWQSISEAAAKQSKRGIIPEIMAPMSFGEAIDFARNNCDMILIPYELAEDMEATRKVMEDIKEGMSIAVFIGPEGGFDESEINRALDSKTKAITLGSRILRTETAGMAVMSILMYLTEK